MKPHEERVIHEKYELDEKINRLVDFMNKAVYPTLDVFEQRRLIMQRDAMKQYSIILGERIQAFQKTETFE